jgi:hypothetical protein
MIYFYSVFKSFALFNCLFFMYVVLYKYDVCHDKRLGRSYASICLILFTRNEVKHNHNQRTEQSIVILQ